jgi:hypothetical protein
MKTIQTIYCALSRTTSTLVTALLLCAPTHASNEVLTFGQYSDGAWYVQVTGIRTNQNPLCEGLFFNAVQIDVTQSPAVIALVLSASGPIPLYPCASLPRPTPYSYKNPIGLLSPNLYRVTLLDNLATAMLDTRPPAVPVNNALALLLTVGALAGLGVAASSSRRRP